MGEGAINYYNMVIPTYIMVLKTKIFIIFLSFWMWNEWADQHCSKSTTPRAADRRRHWCFGADSASTVEVDAKNVCGKIEFREHFWRYFFASRSGQKLPRLRNQRWRLSDRCEIGKTKQTCCYVRIQASCYLIFSYRAHNWMNFCLIFIDFHKQFSLDKS